MKENLRFSVALGALALAISGGAARAHDGRDVDHVLLMLEGRMQAVGPKEEILKRVLARGAGAVSSPLNVVGHKTAG